MGFYGNIASSNKASFSFDLTYTSKTQMDKSAQMDGVFLGRYVLVEYDEAPITAWYNKADKWFYNDHTFEPRSKITDPKPNVLYQDLARINTSNSFYMYDVAVNYFVSLSAASNSPYAANYTLDVQNYGRGYDSTAWVKRYDPATNLYRYSMIAELNSVVPLFHMTVDPPQQNQIAPFFDRDSSNVDYYMHVQPQFGHKIRKALDSKKSDEEIKYKKITWTYDNNKGETYSEVDEVVPGDIYYNAAGFDAEKRHYDADNTPDSINFEVTESGRKYYDKSSTVYDPAISAPDTYEWFIKLPAVGNSICSLWDKMYGNAGNDKSRYMLDAQKRNDTAEHWVTYDKKTLIGSLNAIKDLLGHTFIPKSSLKNTDPITNINATLELEKSYADPLNAANVLTEKVSYKLLDCIFYTEGANKDIAEYWSYKYNPIYLLVADPTLILPNTPVTYYYKDSDNKYRVANTALIGSKNANGEALPYYNYYTRTNRWELAQLVNFVDDSVYGLIIKLHTLIGTNSEDVRNDKTLYGCINHINDIISNISSQLSPGKILHTNARNGMIETTGTFFPSPSVDTSGVLSGNGEWVSRVASISVDKESSTEVTCATPTKGTIVSDYKNGHNNTVTLNVGNKWLGLTVDVNTDAIAISHRLSTLSASDIIATADDALSGVIQTDNKITLPWIKTDNAGHVIEKGSKDFFIPNNFKTVQIAAQSSSNSESTATVTSVVARNVIDKLNIGTQNKWMRIKTAAPDTIQIGHSWSGVIKDTDTWDTSTCGLTKDLPIAILDEPYSLKAHNAAEDDASIAIPQNTFPVPSIRVDRAGHITEIKDSYVTIPENFDKINTEVSDSTESDSITGFTTRGNNFIQPNKLTDTLVLAEGNRWINITPDSVNKKVTFNHYAKSFSQTTSEVDQNLVANNKFAVQELNWDRAGHIIASNQTMYTVPNSFKRITVGDQSTSLVTNAVGIGPGTCIAETAVDELSFYTGNKWLNIAANRAGTNVQADDSITLSHILSGVTKGSYGLASSESIATLDVDNSFEVPYFSVDEAGHVTSAATNTVSLPENFTTIITTATDINEADSLTGSAATISADTLTDTLTLSEGNRWINIASDAATDKITFSHYVKNFIETTSAADINPNKRSLDIQLFSWDKAGHIISSRKTTYTLPVLNSANKWLTIATTDNNNTITFTHPVTAHAVVSVGDETAQTPVFGATFKVPTFTADEAGHITLLSEHTVKIPLPSLINGTVGNVTTGLVLDADNGAFTEVKANVGTLAITGYTQGAATTLVLESDTINSAFAKLQNQIIKEVNDRGTAIANLVNSAPAALDTLKELSAALGNDANFATTVSTSIGTNKIAIENHVADKINPHGVTKVQLGLSNLTNDRQVVGLSTKPVSGHVVNWGADGYTITDSNFTIAANVPANAKFTDTTYSQATNSTLGLTKLYTTTGVNTDGTMTQAAISAAMPKETASWEQKQADGTTFAAIASAPTATGTYRCKLDRTFEGQKVSFYSAEFTI